jgi:hypothetical protein
MAQKTIVQFVDDLDDSSTEGIETVKFALDGATYQIDLNQDHAEALRDIFAEFIPSARRTGGRVKHSPVTPRVSTSTPNGTGLGREQTHAIREWARKKGHQVADRGRIPAAIVEQVQQSSTQRAIATVTDPGRRPYTVARCTAGVAP